MKEKRTTLLVLFLSGEFLCSFFFFFLNFDCALVGSVAEKIGERPNMKWIFLCSSYISSAAKGRDCVRFDCWEVFGEGEKDQGICSWYFGLLWLSLFFSAVKQTVFFGLVAWNGLKRTGRLGHAQINSEFLLIFMQKRHYLSLDNGMEDGLDQGISSSNPLSIND